MFDAPPAARTSSLIEAAEAAGAELWAAAAEHDSWQADLDAMMQPVRRQGLFVACLPCAEGGGGLATEPGRAEILEAVLRRIGGGGLPAGRLFEGHVNAVKLVFLYGDSAVAGSFAADIRAGAVSGVWNAEAPPGLSLVQDADGQRLHGGKIYASGAGWLRRPLVTARTDGGPLLIAPSTDAPIAADLSPWRANGMRPTATGSVSLEGLSVQPQHVVGEPGDYLKAPAFKGGAWRFCAVQLGGAERLFSLLVQHLEARGRGGDPHQRARIGQAAMAVETARLWVSSARAAAEAPGAGVEAEAYVNLARTAVEDACSTLLRLVERSVGLEARMTGSAIERVARDLATYLRQPFPDGALDEAAAARLRGASASPHADWRRG